MSSLTDEEQYVAYFNTLKVKVSFYSILAILPAGFILNIMTSLIFLRKKFSTTTMGFYYTIIALVNNILAIIVMITYLSPKFGDDFLLVSDLSCVFLTFNVRLFAQMSSWLNVFITVDRMVSITYPNKYPFLKNKKKLTLLMLVLFFMLVALNIPNFFFKVEAEFEFNSTTNLTEVTKYCTSDDLVVRVRDTIVLVFRIALPIFLMVLMNIYLVYKLFKLRRKFRSKSELKKEYHFAVSIFAMNVLYTLSLIPSFIAIIFLNLFDYDETSLIGTKKQAIIQFYFSLAILISSYSVSFPFFINLGFNKIFRSECVYLVRRFLRLSTDGNRTRTPSSTKQHHWKDTYN